MLATSSTRSQLRSAGDGRRRPRRGVLLERRRPYMASAPRGLAVRKQKRYGWRPDLPDMRDYLFGIAPLRALPQTVSLRKKMPPVYDQGQLGSCTANSIAAILQFNELKQQERDAA